MKEAILLPRFTCGAMCALNSFNVRCCSHQGRSSVVEQRPFKPKVVGSIPTAPTNLNHLNTLSDCLNAERYGPVGLGVFSGPLLSCGPEIEWDRG
ncbi:MAG: hypothetical protein JWO71_801 [Candidatus Acidoferrum typicum]|nr:hypothetical protein [Candidatus Acidoferrum typicum]